MSDRFRVVPAAYVLLRRGSEVLLQLRAGTGYMDGYWAAGAAGHVESGESVHDAAVRETREELGVNVVPTDMVPVCVMHRTGANGRAVDERVDFFFVVDRWSGQPTRCETAKTAALKWFDLSDLPAELVPYEERVLLGLRDRDLPTVLAYGFDPDEATAQANAARRMRDG